MARIFIKPNNRSTSLSNFQLRAATVEPRAARMDVVLVELEAEHTNHLANLRRIVQKLRKRKAD